MWSILLMMCCAVTVAKAAEPVKNDPELTDWIFFSSEQRLGVIKPDGSDESYPDFALASQSVWRMGYVSPDGREAELYSLESGQSWNYDFVNKSIREIPRQRGVPLPEGQRYLHDTNELNVFSLFTTDLDGVNREEIFSATGFAYGVELSPDGLKVAYHITSDPERPGYEICVVDIASKQLTLIASDHQYLHFGPVWSPDGQWLLYVRCEHLQDPGHDRSDLVISRADGSEHRQLTTGQRQWFAAALGTPERHSSGSNIAIWSPDGRSVTGTLLLPDSQTAWPWATGRPDTDHFNRDYHPELAQGGTQICTVDVETRVITPISKDDPPTWNFRPVWSPDGTQLAFLRADVGKLPELWVMDADGGNLRFLSRGLNGTGADHARWVQLAVTAIE